MKKTKTEKWAIERLKNWDENPREIDEHRFKQLVEDIKRFGDIRPLLVDARPDHEGEVIGGNMRLRAYRELGYTEVWVLPIEPKSDAERFEMALIDNAQYGKYVSEQLAELAERYKEDIDIKQMEINLGSPMSLDFLMAQYGPSEEIHAIEKDQDRTDEKLDAYLNGSIRQIVTYFTVEEYESVLARIKKIMELEQLEDNTSVFLKLLDTYEQFSTSKTNPDQE